MINKNKYRCWDKEEKKMIYDIQNEYDNGMGCGHSFGAILKYKENFEVMQFIGFQIDNKDVYENDIIEYKGKLYVVEYNPYDFGFFLYNKKDDEGLELWYSEKYKHCGNIYENTYYLDELGLEEE